MTKDEMKTNLCLHGGIGVEVVDSNGTNYYFFNDLKNENGISIAYRQLKNKSVIRFFTPEWAKQNKFREFMRLYKKMVELADIADRELKASPFSLRAIGRFKRTYQKQLGYFEFLCEKLMAWTSCSLNDAKRQIITGNINYDSFLERS